MSDLTKRLWITSVLLGICWLGSAWVRSGYTFDVIPLNHTLDSLPMDWNGYHGEDIPLDERVQAVLNADSFINRVYTTAGRSSMILHASAWVRPESINSVALHNPRVCYTNAGWKILKETNTEVSTRTGTIPLGLILVEREGKRCVVAYWYQMGNNTFLTKEDIRRIHREYWGKKQWHPTVKVLLQVSASEIGEALPEIESFASEVHAWTVDL